MSTLQRIDGPGDAELISAVRGGDVSAYGDLFERHVVAARRLARQLVSHGDVDDLVSDAFAKVLAVLQRGGGPDVAFRAYLLTAVRRLHVDKIRATSRLTTTDDMEAFDPGVPFRDTAVEGFENAAAAKAFASLPERWQLVLWHTEVEGAKPAEVAELLGMSPNSVSALAYRAREGLRQAFLNMHAQDLDDDDCRWTNQHVGAYIRNGVSKRDAGKVEAHLDECRKCMAIYLELSEVNSNLSGILAPLLLGSAGAAYLAGSAGVVAKAGLLGALGRARDTAAGRVRDLAGGNGATAAVAGNLGTVAVVGGAVVATAVVGGVLAVTGVIGGGKDSPTAANEKPGSSITTPLDRGVTPGTSESAAPTDAPSESAAPSDSPSLVPTQVSDSPATSPTDSPTDAPTDSPTNSPTDVPTTVPTPGDDVLPDSEGGPVTFDLLANDSNPIDGQLSLLRFSQPQHGKVTEGAARSLARGGAAARAASTGIVTYTPDKRYKGPDSFTYVVGNRQGDTSEGRVRVTVRNGRPVAVADEPATTRNRAVSVNVLRNDTDPNGDDLSVEDFDPASAEAGTVTRDGDRLEYTPQRGFHGVDTFTYRVTDGDRRSDPATVSVAVANQAPQAEDDRSVFTDTNAGLSIDVLGNDSDPDGDALTPTVAAQPRHGTATVNGDGTIAYTPDKGYKGADPFTYTVTDGDKTSDAATVHVTVRNAAPVAEDDFAGTDANTDVSVPVLANDRDPNGDDLTPSIVQGPGHGTATIDHGIVTYSPDKGFRGTDSLTYTVSDGDGGISQAATVTITVRNAAPEADNDEAGTDTNQTVDIAVLEGDSDANGDSLTPSIATGPRNGTATVNADGTITFEPDRGFAGVDTFTYTVSDGAGGTSNEATVTVTVRNAAPTAVDDSAATDKNTPVTVEVLANDTDPNIPATAQSLQPAVVVPASDGTAVVNRDGTVSYQPRAGFAGTDTFTYTVSDGAGGTSNEATVTVTVRNAAPSAGDDLAATDTGAEVVVDVLGNDTDPDGDPLTVTAFDAKSARGGQVFGKGTRLVYRPAPGFKGEDSFGYTVSDDSGATATATVRIAVRNAPPVVLDESATSSGERILVAVLANDTDPNGDRLGIGGFDAKTANGGLVEQQGDRLAYTPARGFHGTDAVGYVVTDGDGGTATGRLTVTVGNSAPVAVADASSTEASVADPTTTIDVLANDTDANGDQLTIVDVSNDASGGVVTIDGGKLRYRYRDDFAGVDTFSYVVADGHGGRTRGDVTVVVSNTAPDAVNDTATTGTGRPVTIDVLANDRDRNGDKFTLATVAKPAKGGAKIDGDRIVYTPAADFRGGSDTFDYTIRDARGALSTGTITVTMDYDVTIDPRYTRQGNRHTFVPTVAGLLPSDSAHVTIQFTKSLAESNLSFFASPPAGCSNPLLTLFQLDCTVTGANPSVTEFTINEVNGPDKGTVVFTVIPPAGTTEDASNNEVTVQLKG